MIEQMQQLTKMLEEAGPDRAKGKDWELTPRAMRKIGERALQDIFGQLQAATLGDHATGPARLRRRAARRDEAVRVRRPVR